MAVFRAKTDLDAEEGFLSFSRAAPVGVRFGLGRVPLTQYRLIEGRSKETSFSGESRGRQQHLRGCDLTVWCGMHVCRWLDVTCMCGRDHAPSRKRQVAETREPETPQMPDPAPRPHVATEAVEEFQREPRWTPASSYVYRAREPPVQSFVHTTS